MKVTIKGYVHWRKHAPTEESRYAIYSFKMEDATTVLVGEVDVEYEMPDHFDPVNGLIRILRDEKKRIQVKAQVEANNIEAQIQELLCIENKVQP